MNSFYIKEALNLLDRYQITYKFIGDPNVVIKLAKSINQLTNNSFSFYRGESIEQYYSLFSISNLVILQNIDGNKLPPGNYILTSNSSLCFNIIGWLLKSEIIPNIHRTAIISEKSMICKDITIGAYSIIGANVKIGSNVVIGEQCYIENCDIGDGVRIQPGVKIGSRGLGSYLSSNNVWIEFPHFGKVIIEEGVLIQDNVVINRGTLNDTIIRKNSRIGPLTWIAHGVQIGESCFISQSVTIAGSVKIGKLAKVWGNSSIRDGIVIGENSIIGMGAVVTKNIPSNETWVGNPAKKNRK